MRVKKIFSSFMFPDSMLDIKDMQDLLDLQKLLGRKNGDRWKKKLEKIVSP